MIGLYFSGTGNTQYCVERFVKKIDETALCFSIEDNRFHNYLKNEMDIVFGYPIYFSNIPIFVRDFITTNIEIFANKNIFIIATMGLFSGDGAGCSARIFRKQGANIVGGLHLKMPDCIGDSALLKKSETENKNLIIQANDKIEKAAQQLQNNRPKKDGLSFCAHIAGLFGQRLWYYNKTNSYKEKPNINPERCIGCGKCVSLCPTHNLSIESAKVMRTNHCTMCYRCVSFCPTKALTILGKEVIEQIYLDKYLT